MNRQKEFVEYVIKLLVTRSDSVKVNVREGEKTNVIEIRAHIDDYGKIIGPSGRFINAIRVLLSVISREDKKRWVVEVPNKESREKDSE
ncbi:hypothetical protein COTS27_00659 [Spirochaetota bacterium]|nr:hypothetical protein COTS27_00659 [Spirochaetota bacterium]